MEKYICTVCGYIYDEAAGDPDNGVAPGTKFEDIPDDWVCHYVEFQNQILKKNNSRYCFNLNLTI